MPVQKKKSPKAKKAALKPHTHLYPRMDWGVIASSPDHPRLAATVRGGTTECPHNHLDLLSYHLAFDGEAIATSVSNRNYMDSTFSDRRFDIWEMRPDAKNTLFIGGVGLSKPADVITKPVKAGGFHGFHLTGPKAIRINMYGNPLVRRIERLFLMLDDKLFIVVDRVDLTAPNQIETRFHTFTTVAPDSAGALLTGKKAVMRVACAATEPVTLATVFAAGNGTLAASFSTRRDGKPMLDVKGRGFAHAIPLPFAQESAS